MNDVPDVADVTAVPPETNALPAAPTQPVIMNITLPEGMPTEVAEQCWQLGLQLMAGIQGGLAVTAMPMIGPTGQPQIQFIRTLLADPQDPVLIERVLSTITRVNRNAIEAQQQNRPDAVEALGSAPRHKENAAREAEGAKTGTGGIIVPD